MDYMKTKKILFLTLASLSFLILINNASFAITDAEDAKPHAVTKKELRAQKRLERKQKRQNKVFEHDDINKNILRPNESPGIMTDTNKTRRYYESLEDAHRTEMNDVLEEEVIFDDSRLELPPRVDNDAATTHIEKVEISKSEIFSDLELFQLKSVAEGQDLTAEDINNFIDLINKLYAKKNIITARAYLESLEGGILKIELMEARIGDITVEGNRFNRKWFLKKMISSKSNDVLNLQTLEEDLRRFNKNARSIKLSAKLKPGEKYGTTDVVLQAEEKFPYHFSASWDSFGRETTGLLRGGLMLSTDSFLGAQDRLTGAVNLARSSTNPFVDYNVPINRRGTRIGGSYMFGKSKISSGDYSGFGLEANTHIFSTYITHPLIDTPRASLNLNTSANIKLSTADISGYRYTDYKDYNIAFGLGGRYNFNKSVLLGSVYSTNGIIDDSIRSTSYYFTKINADGYYIHYLPKGIIATVRAGGQYSPQEISFIEQYQIGGISSVRGYSESLLLAASSYFASFEMLFPIPFLPEEIKVPFRKEMTYRLRDSIKLAAFFDNGAIFPHRNGVGTANFLSSVGAGIRLAISKYLTARVYVGIPLMNTGVYNQSSARVHFDLIASPF